MLSSSIVKILQVAALLTVSAVAFGAEDRVVLNTMSQELQRNFDALKQKADPPPYFLSYEITDQDYPLGQRHPRRVEFDMGESHNRYLDVTVRVGDPKLDNFRRVRGDRVQFTSGAPVPIDDTPGALKQRIWLETDRVYRASADRLIKIKTNQQVKAADRDTSNDFSSRRKLRPLGSARHRRLRFRPLDAKRPRLSQRFPPLSGSALFRRAGFGSVRQPLLRQHRRHEGAARAAALPASSSPPAPRRRTAWTFRISIRSKPPTRRIFPSNDVIQAAVKKVASTSKRSLTAKTAEPFVGPAIFSGRASGVFFHEIFGHRIEGHRQKDESEGQTFTKSVGEKILPDFLSVTFDPTIKRIAGVDLNGYYEYDDEGVHGKARQGGGKRRPARTF